MGDTPAVSSEGQSILLHSRIESPLTEAGLQTQVSVSLPWTRWKPWKNLDLGFELSPAGNFFWRPDGRLFGGGGIDSRFTQKELCVGNFCFLSGLAMTAGYGSGQGAWTGASPYFEGSLSLVEYAVPSNNNLSFQAVAGGGYLQSGFGSAGVEITAPVAAIPGKTARDLNPSDYFEPVGTFIPGRVTYLYYAVELQDENGHPLHPPIDPDKRRALMQQDLRFAFDIKDSPLRGLGNQVNLLISKQPVPVKVQGSMEESVRLHGGKASEIVDLWKHHALVEDMVAAHPEYFGANVQAIAQIPYELRDQFTWFRFDKVPQLVEAATASWSRKDWEAFLIKAASILLENPDPDQASSRILLALLGGKNGILATVFPRLRVPLGWHGAGTKTFEIDENPLRDTGVPQSSVVLFHELFGHGGTEAVALECRASDEYSEGSLEAFLGEHPREAALAGFLGQSIDVNAVFEQILGKAPAGLRKSLRQVLNDIPASGRPINLLSLLTQASLTQDIVGKPLGQPNVLPDDPKVIEKVWGTIPGFKERLWTKSAGRDPKAGDVRIVPGGLYFPEKPFVRLQVFQDGQWRDTYMKDSHNPAAPLGPVMERCLMKTRELILKSSS